MNKIFTCIFLFFLLGCWQISKTPDFEGFWEGPHPEESNKRFFIQINYQNDSLFAKGFWTENHIYLSEFAVEKIKSENDSIQFFVPGWNCTYRGKLLENNNIEGGFYCEGEPFDKVILKKNNTAAQFLTEAKPGCRKSGFQYQYESPALLNDGITTSSVQSKTDSMFIHSLVSEIINGVYGRLNSFLLFKNSHLICEEYFYGYTGNNLHPIESGTKSITSLLVGIAHDKNLIGDLDEPLFKIFPEFVHLKSGDYQKITINHLLSMTSGFEPQNNELFTSENRIEFALKRPIKTKPGTTFLYDGGNTEILGAILQKKTGMFADEFAKKYLFSTLKIENFDWETNKQNGFPSMAGALNLLPRDMIKIGGLILNKGEFNENQIISKQWINESTSAEIKTHIPDDDYSYHWWNIKISSANAEYNAIWANGWGSQFIYIFPELNVVIVTTGHNYENDSWAITSGIAKYLHLLSD